MQDLFWVNLCQPITLTATCSHYDTIVAQSTEQIQQCVTRLIGLLNERSLALLKCAQFDTALRDADAIHKLDPTLPLGYHLKGKVYIARGWLQEASSIYEQSIRIGYPRNDEERHQKQQFQEIAALQSMNQKRVDFISKLPLEIVSKHIIPLLMDDVIWDLKTPCPYLQVSTTWRERFSCGKLCYDITGSLYPPQLVHLPQSVHSMGIHQYSTCPVLVELAQQGQLSGLLKLFVGGIKARDEAHFLSCLRKVGDPVLHLTLSVTESTMLNLRDILERCPRLSSLFAYDIINAGLISALHPYPHRIQPIQTLAVLELQGLRHPVDYQQQLALLEHFPSLQSLTLSPCHDSRFLPMVQQRLPSLQYLAISVQSYIQNPEPQKHESSVSIQRGPQSLYIADEAGQCYNIDDIRQYMVNCCDTLESATILVATLRDDPQPSVHFPRLRQLNCSLTTEHGPPLFGWWIPNHAPLLTYMELSNTTLRRTPKLLQALDNTLQIKSLTLHAASTNIFYLVELLESHARKGKSSCLEELILCMSSNLFTSIPMKYILGELPYLKCLTLGKEMGRFEEKEFTHMMAHLVLHCKNLRELDIQTCTHELDVGLMILSVLDTLESISIPGAYISTTGAQMLLRFRGLRHLTLYNSHRFAWKDQLNIVQQGNPHLKIAFRHL